MCEICHVIYIIESVLSFIYTVSTQTMLKCFSSVITFYCIVFILHWVLFRTLQLRINSRVFILIVAFLVEICLHRAVALPKL